MPSRILISLLVLAFCGASTAAAAPPRSSEGGPAPAEAAQGGKRCERGTNHWRACRRARAERRRARERARRERLRLQRARPFAPDSFWNARLSDNAKLDPKSSAYVDRLHQLLARWEPYVNTTRFSTPVYTVPKNQPMVRVTLDNVQRPLQAAFEEVPIPRHARPAAGTDGHMVVWQPSTDTMWEFWVAQRRLDGWHARYGGRMENVSENPGHFTAPNPRWGATATSLPLLGGLMRLDELAAGRIDHALAMALPELRANAYSWPAQRSDGGSHHVNAIPEGARFRINPNLDLSKLSMSPIVRAMARAVQRHGAVVRDGGGAVAFYAEDPSPTGLNPFMGRDGLFGGRYISQMLRDEFPWEHLQVLKTEMTYEGPLSGL